MNESVLANPYEYHKGNNNVEISLTKKYPDFHHYKLQFRSAIDTGYAENGVVKSELYLPQAQHQFPLMILVHGMGDLSIIPCKLIARQLVKEGIACCIPYLTIHSKRMPLPMKQKFPVFSDKEWFQSYRLSVIDIRQIIDWADDNGEYNTENTGVLGISFGGLVSSIAMGADQRIKAGVFIVSGGNSPKIEWLSQNRRYQKSSKLSEEKYHEKQHAYNLYLDEVSRNGFQNVKAPFPGYLLDPMTYASNIKNRRVQMINAKYDKYIPRQAAIDFWEACGKPPIKWIPLGHTSLWLWAPAIVKTVRRFAVESFEL
ncbi:MAG: alpha/beta hydrolase family protein [Dehalococcoidales bacterium]|nr:alpha/beta hydrolase family protein [Dehalococcoidales bacterium]